MSHPSQDNTNEEGHTSDSDHVPTEKDKLTATNSQDMSPKATDETDLSDDSTEPSSSENVEPAKVVDARTFDDILRYVGAFQTYQIQHWLIITLLMQLFVIMCQQLYTYGELKPKCYNLKTKFYQSTSAEGLYLGPCLGQPSTTDDGSMPLLHEAFYLKFLSVGSINNTVRMSNEGVRLVGRVVGAALFGQLAFHIGRKQCIAISFACGMVMSILSAVTLTAEHKQLDVAMIIYIITKFLSGVATAGFEVSSTVLLSEIVLSNWRPFVLVVGGEPLAYLLYAILVQFRPLQHLRHLHWVLAVVGLLLLIPFWLFVQESPRWLYCKGRLHSGNQIVKKMADRNGRVPPLFSATKFVHGLWLYTDDRPQCYSFKALFRTVALAKYTIVLTILWSILYLLDYGNIYFLRHTSKGHSLLTWMTFGYWATGNAFSALLHSTLRRRSASAIAIGTSLFILVLSFVIKYSNRTNAVRNDTLTIALYFLGGVLIKPAFASLYLQTFELFPTPIRSQALGLIYSTSHVVITLSMLLMDQFIFNIQSMLYTSLCVLLLAFILIWLVPETRYTDMEDQMPGTRSLLTKVIIQPKPEPLNH